MIHVLIVDDHAVVRAGIRQILEQSPSLRVTAEAASGADALRLLDERAFDLVILDIGLPDISGVELLRRIKEEKPAIPVLVLSMYREDQYALRVLRSGAAGYLTKESAAAECLAAVEKVMAGGRYVSPALAEKLVDLLHVDADRPPHSTLSDREFDVFRRLATGAPLKAIAKELALSSKTVSTYRSRVLSKMGMKSNAELVQYAVQHQLI